MLAPILEGGGTRLKIIEAWSQGKAVVTTAKGIEGLPGPLDVAALADDAATFAAATAALLLDSGCRQVMGGRALEVFRERLSWDVAVRTVTSRSVVAEAGRAGASAAR
jgi:polysaccharide biosynthesis protein PslH